MEEILILGAGSWGTALGIRLAENGHQVWLWDTDAGLMERIGQERCNERFLPGIRLPEGMAPLMDWERVKGKNVIMAVPCASLEAACRMLVDISPVRVCLACKGFAVDADARSEHFLNHEVVEQALPSTSVSVLSGPSFALDVAQGKPVAVTVSAATMAQAQPIADLFHATNFRCYTQDDMIGVQIGGAVKNVMAIAAGVADGLGLGASARAALITRGLREITHLGMKLGGREETFRGLSGAGDLILTCCDDKSRNRRMGLALARGLSLEEAYEEIVQVVEGVHTSFKVERLAQAVDVEMPIAKQVAHILRGDCSARSAVEELLFRSQRAEWSL
ncbi:MAG: NAD(P)H-dependent glycerol-3-phosphate dehydrogenase [Candidatus Eutrophobiaceae bacterium]